MIFNTFLAAVGIGLFVFVAGIWADRPDLAFVGAVFVIGAGAVSMRDGGVMVRTGTDVVVNNTSSGQIRNATAVYEPASSTSSFSLGFLSVVLGAFLGFISAGLMSQQ